MLLAFFSAAAQNEAESNPPKRNEVKLNVVMPLAGTFEATYERILNSKSAVGVTSSYVFNDNGSNDDMNFFISPYYRRYFGQKYASGWFVEGFAMLTSIDGKKVYTTPDRSQYIEKPSVLDAALGAGGGYKWVSKTGFLVEANFCYGGLLFNTKKTDHNVVAKFGVHLGYRF